MNITPVNLEKLNEACLEEYPLSDERIDAVMAMAAGDDHWVEYKGIYSLRRQRNELRTKLPELRKWVQDRIDACLRSTSVKEIDKRWVYYDMIEKIDRMAMSDSTTAQPKGDDRKYKPDFRDGHAHDETEDEGDDDGD